MLLLTLITCLWLSRLKSNQSPSLNLSQKVLPSITVESLPTTTTVIQRVFTERAARSESVITVPQYQVVTGDIFDRLANCESGGNPRAVGGRGRFYGAFQFMLSTWHSIGETGNPIDYTYEHQKAAAIRLQKRSGWGQWPVCSRRLGVR